MRFWRGKKHPADRLNIKNFIREGRKKVITLPFGIGEAIIAAIGSVATFLTSSSTIVGVSIGGTVYGVSGAFIGTIVLNVAIMGVKIALTPQPDAPNSSIPSGGLLEYRRVST